MKKNEIKTIQLDGAIVDHVERLWAEYNAKKDIIMSIFEQHKFAHDTSLLDSVPFKHYEKAFHMAKAEYELTMKEIEEKYVPQELRDIGSRFEVHFEEKELIITPPGVNR